MSHMGTEEDLSRGGQENQKDRKGRERVVFMATRAEREKGVKRCRGRGCLIRAFARQELM